MSGLLGQERGGDRPINPPYWDKRGEGIGLLIPLSPSNPQQGSLSADKCWGRCEEAGN